MSAAGRFQSCASPPRTQASRPGSGCGRRHLAVESGNQAARRFRVATFSATNWEARKPSVKTTTKSQNKPPDSGRLLGPGPIAQTTKLARAMYEPIPYSADTSTKATKPRSNRVTRVVGMVASQKRSPQSPRSNHSPQRVGPRHSLPAVKAALARTADTGPCTQPLRVDLRSRHRAGMRTSNLGPECLLFDMVRTIARGASAT
jgi:hypothetical protein